MSEDVVEVRENYTTDPATTTIVIRVNASALDADGHIKK